MPPWVATQRFLLLPLLFTVSVTVVAGRLFASECFTNRPVLASRTFLRTTLFSSEQTFGEWSLLS